MHLMKLWICTDLSKTLLNLLFVNLTLNLAVKFTCILLCCNYCVGYCLQVSSSLIMQFVLLQLPYGI